MCHVSQSARRIYLYAEAPEFAIHELTFMLVRGGEALTKALEYSRAVLARFPGLPQVALEVDFVVWAPDCADVSVLESQVLRSTMLADAIGVRFEGRDRLGRVVRSRLVSWGALDVLLTSPLGVAFQSADPAEGESTAGERLIERIASAWGEGGPG